MADQMAARNSALKERVSYAVQSPGAAFVSNAAIAVFIAAKRPKDAFVGVAVGFNGCNQVG